MSGPKVASKAAAGGPTIPAADRKLICTVKEVATNHSDEEIYAMLKECNRDPNDAAQRLLSQGNFHVVMRKRDRKKESGTTKDQSDSRQSNSGNYGRGGRSTGNSGSRSSGRGVPPSRNEGTGGRSRVAAPKESDIPSVVKSSSSPVGGGLSYSQLVQPKTSYNNATNMNVPPSTGLSNGETLQAISYPSIEGGWPASSGHSASTALQGAWLAGSGHGTIADMLKSGGRKPNPLLSSDVISTASTAGIGLEQLSVSSMHMPALDPSVNLPYESHMRSPNNIMNREIGAGGISRFAGDMASLQDGESSHYAQASNSVALSLERDAASYQPAELNGTAPLEEQAPSASGYQGRVLDLQEGQSSGLGNQFNGPSSYHGLQYAESQQENTNVDWGSHLLTHEEAPAVEAFSEGRVPDVPSSPPAISNSAAKLHELNLRDNHSVIIPDHIRVSEADCTMLSFGSFDVGFDGLSSKPTLLPETESHAFSASESTAVGDLTAAMRSLSTSVPPSTTLEHEQSISSIPDPSLHGNPDANGIADENESKEEEELSEPPAQHEYAPSYSVIDAVSSDHTRDHYAAVTEDRDSRPRDVSAVLPQYDNSTYYSGVFRSVPEIDSRYSAFSQLAASGKLSTSRPAEPPGQNASPEVVNASVYSNSNTVGGQTMPAVNNGPSAMTLPQHSMHPYATQPSGLPLGPFANVLGYQYMPPGFSYVQSPYQHNYVGTSNYHQVPTAVGAGAMKFPVPQYKTGGPVVGGIHNTMSPSSLGYGGYPNSQPTANLPVTSGNTSTFDDAATQHYKDNTMYLPSQQIDGPSVWLQSQLAREAQGSSYYNVPGQSQPTRYSQTQSLLTHTHPAAVYGGNIYHPQQSGSSASAHQLLQQQQALGSMGALGTQIGSYQQNQRAQPTWAPGPY
ncbi:hypothetical protein GOP47_0021383 [Adiantum capillus-veneris]|uniref:GBF-interacting protein 1 N-terminal domain-containing protein n=1 Tax=Adiantum capillus-veneris TaxID=13818 RepID=A0A9D4U9H4_ADICA|nr:hypothetical protein GOP47_0021383 [Adiantum capillus-veneris]